MAAEGDIITLNVGGTEFTTTLTTLGVAPYFAHMFDPDSGRPPALKDSKGNYFIDSSPKTFEAILNYLRTGKVNKVEGVSDEELNAAALFFGIELPKEVILLCHKSDFRYRVDGPNPEMKMYKFTADTRGDYKLDVKGDYGYGLSDTAAWSSPTNQRLQIYSTIGQQEPNGYDVHPDWVDHNEDPPDFHIHEKLLPGWRTILFCTVRCKDLDDDTDTVDMLPYEARMNYEKDILQDWERKWNSATHVNADPESPLQLNKYRLEHTEVFDPNIGGKRDCTIFRDSGKVKPE